MNFASRSSCGVEGSLLNNQVPERERRAGDRGPSTCVPFASERNSFAQDDMGVPHERYCFAGSCAEA